MGFKKCLFRVEAEHLIYLLLPAEVKEQFPDKGVATVEEARVSAMGSLHCKSTHFLSVLDLL